MRRAMQFEVGQDAAALREAADAVLSGRATSAVVRAGWAAWAPAEVRSIWRALADIGVVGALVPEAAGGLGLDQNSLPPVAERLGNCALPAPAVETLAVAAPLLAAAGHPALPEVLSGAALVTAQLAMTMSPGLLVPFGSVAEYVLLRADDGGLRLFERGELDFEPVPAVDASRQLARLLTRPGGGAVLAGPADPQAEAAWQRGVLGTAAALVGLADRMLSMTVGYVKNRSQFGVPVGSFQAIKHRLADALVSVEFARPAVLAAGWAQADGVADEAEQTSVAKVLASDAAAAVAGAAIQCHGAMGYTTEYDLHLYAKRAWALARSWGSADWHRHRLAQALGLEGKDEANG
jgi:alkylation response protein AidB-like acyl-CoA dehydrogenase